jgi:hypothetical protein
MSEQGFTRREVLAGGLAVAGAAVAGCGGSVAGGVRRTIQGEMVGQSHQLGHLLRNGGQFPPPVRTERVTAVIVGGGVAGLSAVRRFHEARFRDFVLLELEDTIGGNARSGASRVTPYPWGAHYLTLPGPEAKAIRRLLADLGVIEKFDRAGRPVYEERYLCHAPQERLYIHARWQEGLFPHTGATEEDLAQYQAFREKVNQLRRWRDAAGRRAFSVPRAAGARGVFRKLDRLSMADFLASQGWTSPRLRWFVEYACRDDFGTGLAETSAWAGVHYYASRDPDPEYGDVVLTWPEGNGWLVQRMAEGETSQIRSGHLVYNVEPSGKEVVVEAYEPASHKSLRLMAREVILACPVFVASRIFRPWRERPPAFAGAFRYAPWLVANLHLSRLPADGGGAPLAWDNVIYDSPSLGYVVATHQSVRTHAGETVWTYYLPFPRPDPVEARRELLGASWTSVRDRILSDLSRPHPEIAGSVRRVDVMLYGHAMVRPEVGFVCGRALAAAGAALQGPVQLAHSDLSGFSLFEEAYEWGRLAAARALARLGRGGTERI